MKVFEYMYALIPTDGPWVGKGYYEACVTEISQVSNEGKG